MKEEKPSNYGAFSLKKYFIFINYYVIIIPSSSCCQEWKYENKNVKEIYYETHSDIKYKETSEHS